jgi:hypothetical protein
MAKFRVHPLRVPKSQMERPQSVLITVGNVLKVRQWPVGPLQSWLVFLFGLEASDVCR